MPDWGQVGQGAAGGAMAGAAFGPWGAAIGGVGGGLLGLLGGDDGKDKYQSQLEELAAGYGNRKAPQLGAASQAGYSDFRKNQAGLIAQLEAMARGEGPSAATMQMREAMDRAAGAQASAAAGAGGRGVNAGAALRNATNNTAAIQSQGARDTGLMRVQEQLGATQQLGQNIGAGRGADEGINVFNAGAQNDAANTNLQAQLHMLGLNQSGQMAALMAAMGMAGPGLGTQILAGGATAAPGLMQMQQQQHAAQQGLPWANYNYQPGKPAKPAADYGQQQGAGVGSGIDNPWGWV